VGETTTAAVHSIDKIPYVILKATLKEGYNITPEWRFIGMKVTTAPAGESGVEVPSLMCYPEGGFLVNISRWNETRNKYASVVAAYIELSLGSVGITDGSVITKEGAKPGVKFLWGVAKASAIDAENVGIYEPFVYLEKQMVAVYCGSVDDVLCLLHLAPAVNKTTGKPLARLNGLKWAIRMIGLFINPKFNV